MELLGNLALGLGAACTPTNLLVALIGSLVGLLAGVLPRVGPVVSIALLLPATLGLAPLSVLILLTCVVIGAQHGGLVTAILDTGIGGYPMASTGGAGPALAAAATGTFIAGCAVILVWAALTPLLAMLAFGPAEYCALMLLGLMGSVVLASGTLLKAMAMALLGLLLGLVGNDAATGLARFDFGIAALGDGLGFVAVAMGVLGGGAIVSNLAHVRPVRQIPDATVHAVRLPSRESLKVTAPAVLRGAVHTALLPLVTLGLPLNAVMALMLGALGLHQSEPGLQAVVDNPLLFWGLLASIGVGNVMLLALHLPLIRAWARLRQVPYRWVAVVIVLLCALGIFSMRHSAVDVWLVAGLGALGYLLNQLDLDPVPLLLGFVLGPRLEDNLRQALTLSRGDWSMFVARPVSAGLLLVALLMLFLVLLPVERDRRGQASSQH
jgi:TctA family transporter